MKYSRKNLKAVGQLEFEDLMAEATDVCLRMRSVRRKDLVFCPLRIPGWQTSESLWLHLNPVVSGEAWLEDRFENLLKAATLGELLIMAAAYISELLDQELAHYADVDLGESGYAEYCGSVIEELGTDESDETQIGVFCWNVAKAVLEAYGQRHTLSEYELLEQLESEVFLDEELANTLENRKTHISKVLAGCLCYLHGWCRGIRHG